MDQIKLRSTQDFLEHVDALSKKAADSALAHLRKELRVAQKTNQSDIGRLLLRMAMVSRGQREYAVTLRFLDEAKTFFQKAGDDVGLAFVYYELLVCNREMQRNALALEYAHKAAQLFESKQMHEELGWLYNEISIVYLNLSRKPESLANAKKAKVIFTEINSQEGLFWNACHLGSLHGEMGLYEDARAYFEQGLKVATESKNEQGVAWSLLWLGRINKELGIFDAANKYLAKAKALFTELGLKDRIGMCLLHEAAIYRTEGATSDAIDTNRQAIRYFSPTRHHDGVAWALLQTGQVQRDQGQFMKAWQTFREALNLHMDVANRKGIAWVENELGRTYLELNDLNHARESFLKSLGIAQQLDILPLKAELARNMQGLLLEEGRLAESEKQAADNLGNGNTTKLADLRAEVLLEQVRHAVLTGSLDAASSRLNEAKALAATGHNGRLLPAIEIFEGEISARKGDLDAALKSFEKAMETADKVKQPQMKTHALLGVAQIRCARNNMRTLDALMDETGKDIRANGWRRLKAKHMAVKVVVDYKLSTQIDHRVFDQIKHILESGNLTVSLLEMLRMQAYFYQKAGFPRERQEAEGEIRALLKKGPRDLQKVKPRGGSLEFFPISLII